MRSSSDKQMRASPIWGEDVVNTPSTSNSQQRIDFSSSVVSHPNSKRRSNVYQLLARREVSPRTKHSAKKLWGESSKWHVDSSGLKTEAFKDARNGLISWVEAVSLRHLSAKYCPLLPPPRSTIAAAFSPDGKTLASTQFNMRIFQFSNGFKYAIRDWRPYSKNYRLPKWKLPKGVDWPSEDSLGASWMGQVRASKSMDHREVYGVHHKRSMLKVRFHPLYPDILASGSLDHEVRLWDANTAECIGSHRPIASIAFHAQGEILAVASGHKLYIWHYNRRGETSSPTIVLRTRRSLRAVHFHPHAAPFLLTAEVNDLDSPDSSMTLATGPGYLRYPPPTVYLADAHSGDRASLADELPLMSLPFLIWPSISRDDGRTSLQHTDMDAGSNNSQQRVDPSTSVRLLTYSTPSGQYELLLSPIEPTNSSPAPDDAENHSLLNEVENVAPQTTMDTIEAMEVQPEERTNQFFPFSDPTYWELPFLQGWLMGQSHAGQRTRVGNDTLENLSAHNATENPMPVATSGVTNSVSQPRLTGRCSSRHRSSRSRMIPIIGSGEGAALSNISNNETDPQPVVSRIQSELASSLAAAAAAELPCTVKLRIWPHDIKEPCALLDLERCRLTIPHAVLCSEMGAHFSPCGRFLAACVACMLPHIEGDPGSQTQVHHEFTGAATSPTRHPISAHQVVYELRIYSLEEATFGSVLASRAIRAAHCLTSIQFSPTSEHLLLAYGRRHSSLLKSVVIDGETTVPIYTILEVYRVSNMELVRVLPSAEDEVNVACFHPTVGGGLVYGTKEGKLRILQYDSSHAINHAASCFFNENMLE
ncbi:hypothetical protein RJ641_021514, partial [Dillenia turbinata]